MDYCYACRRHLNGAYSCPGCGTPADQLKLPQVGETAQMPPIVVDDDPGEEPPAGGGRAAARGLQRRRTRGRQQRVAVYGIGLVAGVAALATLSMAALSGGEEPAGSTPSQWATNDSAGAPTGTTSPDITESAQPHKGGPASSSPHRRSPSTTATTGSATPSDSPTTAPTVTTATTRPAASSAPPSHTTRPTHSANPSPSATCKQVLWWCQ